MHILHLEDSQPDAELIQALLKEYWPDCRITTITTAEDYERAVARGEFDVILSDYTLPGYSGLEALAFARSRHPDRPFIYMSGTIGEERAIEALKAGATDYVIKDRPARLIPAIRAAITHVEHEAARKLAEEKIREQASLLDKAHDAICVTDPACRITYWNASAERLYGWAGGEVHGRDLRELLYGDDGRQHKAAWEQVMLTREWRGQLRPRPRNGDPVTVESSWSLVSNPDGSPRSVLMIDSDITERLKVETQLMAAQRLETIGLLAGGIAHDLNNVLAPILTSVDLLREHVHDAEDRDILEALEQSAEHGADLVRQLLAFARGSGGKLVEVAVDNLVEGVRGLLQRAMPPSIELKSSLPDELWLLQADLTQLRQVLLNLCINSRDAMPHGGSIELRAENVRVEPLWTTSVQGQPNVGPYVCISVSDSGTGIPREILGKIFDPLFTTKQVGKGTGLGLSNVAAVVKSHGGFIDVQSTVNVGTTFQLFFPALVRSDGKKLGEVPARLPLHGRGERVLIIEDDEAVGTVLQVILETRGYTVEVLPSGAQGLAQIQATPDRFALVITDLNTPGFSGLQMIQALRSLPIPPNLIAITGLWREHHTDPVLQGVEVLLKPVTSDTLLSAVARALRRQPQSG